jgi:UDP-glucose 4-epimerase
MARILLTGSTGFVGPALAQALAAAGHTVTAAGRTQPAETTGISAYVPVGPQHRHTDWQGALQGIEVVVHAAGHAHAESRSQQAQDLIHEVNVLGTERLARQAAAAGARRIVYLSSIKVFGEDSGDAPYTAGSPLRPADPYGVSKVAAEQRLAEIAQGSGMQAVIIRPPMLIGARSKANLVRLIQLVRTGLPLPFASVQNARSVLSVSNLAELVALCVTHPRAAEAPLLAADAVAPSTPQLIRWVASALQREPRLVRCPPALLLGVARAVGLRDLMRRLISSQALDYRATTALTGWTPRRPPEQAIRDAVVTLRGMR